MSTILKRIDAALENLIEAIEIDGTLLHSDACGCDTCEAIASARAALKEAKPNRHYHVNNGKDDACAQCGLDLRNGVHLRAGELDQLLAAAHADALRGDA